MIKVLGADVAILPIEDDLLSSSGLLHLPEQSRQRVDQGVIIYTGPLVSEVKRGDHVLFSGYSGDKVSVEDEGVFFIMGEQDVLAILTDIRGPLVLARDDVIRLIRERISEARLRDSLSPEAFGQDLIDRLQNYVTIEGLEF